MVSIQPFNTRFTLSRDYLAECFDQSLPHGKNAKPGYLFPALSFTAGAGLLQFSEQLEEVGIILVALAALELLHIRYRRAWWLARQMWGASANSEVSLTLDEKGVRTDSAFAQTALGWADIEHVVETDLGYILVAKLGGRQYLSKSLFPEGLIDELVAKYK